MKIPLNLVRESAERIEAQRECGECTACCVLPGIPIGEDPDLLEGKRGYTPCKHLCSINGGCSIYEKRPQLCRDYKCLWKAGLIIGDVRRRPDHLGLMFTFDEVGGEGVIEAWELWDGAARENPGRYLLDSIARYARVYVRFYGIPAALNYTKTGLFELGRSLSQATKECPQAVAGWLETKIGLAELTALNRESVERDLEPLRRGEPVPRHYQPK